MLAAKVGEAKGLSHAKQGLGGWGLRVEVSMWPRAGDSLSLCHGDCEINRQVLM